MNDFEPSLVGNALERIRKIGEALEHLWTLHRNQWELTDEMEEALLDMEDAMTSFGGPTR